MSSEPVHSNFIGGSNAAARIACPASYQMELRLPVSARKETSVYADEGSALHAAMAHALIHNLQADDLLGMVFEPWTDHPITQELVDEALRPCLAAFETLDEGSDEGLRFHVEKRVTIPFLPGVFGTCDLLARDSISTILADYKFGVGERVDVWKEVMSDAEITGRGVIDISDSKLFEEYGVPNAQLMFYALGALNSYPEMFETRPDWPIELVIIQPRCRDDAANADGYRGVRIVTVERRHVEAFGDLLRKTATEARSDTPRMERGAHCRFMSCKSICPLHTGPLFDVGALFDVVTKAQLQASVKGDEIAIDWGKTFGLMLDMANRIEPLVKEWRLQAQTYLEEGNPVAGWKLVNKRASRKWVKPDKSVERKLARLGLSKDERMPRELASPPQVEKILKKRGLELPEGYFDAVSAGLTLAPDGDPRKSHEPVSSLIDALATSLAAITR